MSQEEIKFDDFWEEIYFNDLRSYTDLGFYLEEFLPQPPAQQTNKMQVPGMNGSYDFSTVLSQGEPVFEERKITCTLYATGKNEEELLAQYSGLLSWIMVGERKQLYYSNDKDYYYLAKVEDSPSYEISGGVYITVKITFMAQPLKTSIYDIGEDLWDEVDFVTDWFQDGNTFTISGTTEVEFANSGRSINPTINCSAAMTLVFEGITYNLTAGDNYIYSIFLKYGLNTLQFTGAGTVTILAQKEIL
jgi:phage-related protein